VRNSNLYYLHTLGEKISDSVEIIPGVFMGGNFDILKKMLFTGDVKKDEVRFFVGYSGWSPEQLESEIESKSWFVANVNKDILMNSENNDLWKTIMKSMGKRGQLIANLPEDPSLN
jgi:putative transcriptional regulator